MEQLRERLTRMQEWSPVELGLIPVGITLPVFAQYMVWCLYVNSRPDRTLLVDMQALHIIMTLVAAAMAVAIAIIVVGLRVRRVNPASLLLQHVSAQYFSISNVVLGYFVGSLNFAAGVLMLGAPIFGFILLDRRAVWPAFIVAYCTTAGLLAANALGLLPYAPLMSPTADTVGNVFWLWSYLSYAVPDLVLIILLADRALSSWRQREELVRELSRTDPLTGIHNRRSIMEMVEREVLRTLRHGPPLAVVLLDLDFFKKVNDTWGHPTGDLVLKETARVLRSTIRQSDAVGRFGGEEFLLLLSDTSLEGAAALVERCRERLANIPITTSDGNTVSVSGSFGLASNEQCHGLSAQTLTKCADEALYRAKEMGRNRVEVAMVKG